MKILHLCDWYRPFGGAERLLFGMLEVMEQAGHENIVVANRVADQKETGRRPEYFLENLEINFAQAPRLSALYQWVKKLRSEISDIIKRHGPDAAHVHNLQNPFVLKAVTQALPTVRSIHDPRLYCFTDWRLLPNKDICPYPLGRHCVTQGCLPLNIFGTSKLIKQLPYRLLHLKAHRRVDALIAESPAVRDCLLQNGFPPEQIALLPNFTESYGSWEEVREFNKRHHDPGARTVLFVGRASQEKGLDYLLSAMARVPKPWRLVLVTGGEQLASVREKIRSLGIAESVELPGVLSYEATRACYARADVVVFPSVWIESFGLVGLEAMANGKPVVAFRTGGIPEWLDDGRTGFLVNIKDTQGLAERIKNLLERPELAQELGRNGYERAAGYFNKEIYRAGLLGIYRAAVEKRTESTNRGSEEVKT